MEQHRNSQTSLLSAIMDGGKPAEAPKNLAAERSAASIRRGPQVPRGGGSYSRAVRRQRKAGRVQRVEKINRGKQKLQFQREQKLDTAAQLGRIYLDLIPASDSAKQRVGATVERQAKQMVTRGEATDHADAVEQIKKSMLELIRQHDVLQAQKIQAQLGAAKQQQMDALRSRIDARG